MISIKDNAVYIENITEQDSGEKDWVAAKETELKYATNVIEVVGSKDDKIEVKTLGRMPKAGEKVLSVDGSAVESNIVSKAFNEKLVLLDTPDEINMFQSSDIQENDHFGTAIALSGDGLVALVGAYAEDTTASDAGKVYTYKRSTIDDDWTEVNMFQSSDIETDDHFGSSVALSGNGLVALVGADSENTTATAAGKVYTYKRATIDDDWTEVNSFQSSDVEESDLFGAGVALSSNGLVALVGARDEDTTASNAGKVYTYKRATIDDDWTEVNMFQSSDIEEGDHFGRSVALSGDGLVALVGAETEDTIATNAGKVYTYKRDTIDDDWTEVNMFQSSDIEEGDYFGRSVALSGDGLMVLVGARKKDTTATDAGKVYTYKRDSIDDDWTEVNMFQSSDVEADDYFGNGVALSSDGLVALVGAYGEDTTASGAGKVYTFKLGNIVENTEPILIADEINSFQSSDVEEGDHFGISVALSNDGLVALVGAHYEDTTASNAGKVYTYKRATIDDNWTEVNSFQSSDVEEGDYFGGSVALSGDGLVAIVGARNEDTTASNAGKVYTYKRATIDDNWTEVNSFQSSDIEEGDYFGVSVALSSDGLVALVGTHAEDTTAPGAGKVYTYKRVTIDDDWTEVNMFQSSDVGENDNFGVSVALSDDGLVALVGAFLEDTTASNAGKVYTYKRATIDDDWTEVNSFQSSDIEASDYFGVSVALSGDGLVVLVGATREDTTATDAGKVYTYKRATIDDDWTEVNMFQSSDIEADDRFGRSVALSSDGLVALVGAFNEDTTVSNAGKVYTYKLLNGFKMELQTPVSTLPVSFYYGDEVEVSISLEDTPSKMLTLPEEHIELDPLTVSDGSYLVSVNPLKNSLLIVNSVEAMPGDITTIDDNGVTKYKMMLPNHNLTSNIIDAYYKGNVELEKVSSTTTEYVGKTEKDLPIMVDDKVILDGSEVTVNNVTSEIVYDLDLEHPKEINSFQSSDIEASDYFGISTALSGDGLVALVGAYQEDTTASDAGKVYTYKRDTIDDDWTEVNMFQSSDIEANDYFGRSVALSGDGLVALVGAYYEDTTVGNAGKVYTYKRDTIDDNWTEVNMFQSSDIEADDKFGTSVALSSDGLVALVGAHAEDTTADGAGKVYTYKRATIDDDWTEVNMFQSSDIEEGDNFGISVALSSDGLTALVGALYEDTTASNAGKVYTYKRDSIDDDWTEVNMFQSSDVEADDYFGISVALSGDGLVALVGAFNEDATATNAGKVYTYKRATIDDDWTEVNMFQSSDIEASDYFGSGVALSSDGLVALVGAYGEDTTASGAGKVYTFKLGKDLNQYTLSFDELTEAPDEAYILDKSVKLPVVSKTFDGTYFINKYDTLTKQGRAIQRKIRASKKDTTVVEPLTTQLDMLS